MKKNAFDLIFFHFIENKNMSNMKKIPTFYFHYIWSYLQSNDQNYPKIMKIWQHAVIPIFPPGARTNQNNFLSSVHL